MKNQTEINKEVKSYRTFLLQNKGIYYKSYINNIKK